MKIAIAGPGRSGTSLLVKLLGAWGFSIPAEAGNWDDAANAGLESKIGGNSLSEVDKDPWAYQYLHRISPQELTQYSALFVPIRDLDLAATSRSVRDRMARPDTPEHQYWMWNDWGAVPGGAVYQTNVESQKTVLALGLWKLLSTASLKEMNIVIINFPKFAENFEYLWKTVSPFVSGKVTKQEAKEKFDEIVDPGKIRISSKSVDLSLAEAVAIAEEKSKENYSLLDQLQQIRKEMSQSIDTLKDTIQRQEEQFQHELVTQKKALEENSETQVEVLSREIREIKNTLSWKITRPLRMLRKFTRKH